MNFSFFDADRTPARRRARGWAGISWGTAAVLGLVALVRPIANMAGVSDAVGRPLAPLALTVLVTACWVAVARRRARPVATLAAAGAVYAVAAVALSGVASPLLDGRLDGPLTRPWTVVAVAAVNVAWGVAAGGLALLTNRSRR